MTTTVNVTRVLDLRVEAPQRRTDLVFETFAGLAPGASYFLVSNQSPKPLHYQFAAEYAGAYTWDYIEEGPTVWRVRIGRRARAPQRPRLTSSRRGCFCSSGSSSKG